MYISNHQHLIFFVRISTIFQTSHSLFQSFHVSQTYRQTTACTEAIPHSRWIYFNPSHSCRRSPSNGIAQCWIAVWKRLFSMQIARHFLHNRSQWLAKIILKTSISISRGGFLYIKNRAKIVRKAIRLYSYRII